MKVDLHCHSIFSDGELTPKELVYLAKKKQLNGISITDHDTVSGYSKDLFSLADYLGVKLITGVEISTILNGESIHILGYNFSISDKLNNFLKKASEMRYRRNVAILKKLSNLGFDILEEELYLKQKIAGRPHIAKLMVEKGYVKDYDHAFKEYLKQGAKGYVLGEKYSPKEAVSFLHEINAKAVLAHPHIIKKRKTIKEILLLNLDGIEGYYAKLPLDKRWIEIAEKNDLIVTGGSDFHGYFRKFDVDLGCSWTNKESFEKLFMS